MIKNEQLRVYDQLKQTASVEPVASFPLRPSMLQPKPIDVPQRPIDPHAIDISSIKGRFAWEKIALADTYVPVIFRGTTRYFCVKMLHKLLPEFPENFITRSSSYQYRKPIDMFDATRNEIELLNRINVQHAHWTYSRQPLTSGNVLVRVSDFLPFYEHLRLFAKPSPPISRSTSIGSKKQIPPQRSSVQQSPDFVVRTPSTNRRNTCIASPMRLQPANDSSSHSNIPSVRRPIAERPPVLHPMQSSKYSMQPFEAARQVLQQELSLAPTDQPTVTASDSIINSTDAAQPWIVASSNSSSHSTLSTVLTLPNRSESSNADSFAATPRNNRKLSTGLAERQSISSSVRQSSPIASISRPGRLYCGWLQINKLYTPFLSVDPSNHHLYRIPVSLLTYYGLLKISLSDNSTSEVRDFSVNMEQTVVTPQEIELINDLCLKQSIKPFSIDTKLISLATFYRYYSANTLFVKELPLGDPKGAICKDWSAIVQINGGICRLRNITTLDEQTVPFIGKRLIKIFNVSSQCSPSASITVPTPPELEFLQLILFFCNISINLRHAKLIDLESVQKEYTVDLILLYNDKFPSNVLNYQQQGSQPTNSQEQVRQSDISATTNTFAESTPPPSPISPATNPAPAHPVSQSPVNSAFSSLISFSASTSSPSTASSSPPANRYQKTVTFHGHPMTAYVCSGLESSVQRECVSIRELCTVLYPNSTILDKLESRMLRLLRAKAINRFRPQNQQALALTRLVDIKDIETHWSFIEQGMTSSSNNDGETSAAVGEETRSLPNTDLKASKTVVDARVEDPRDGMEVDKEEKRPLESEMEEEEKAELSSVEQGNKRVRLSGDDDGPMEQSESMPKEAIEEKIDQPAAHADGDDGSKETDDDSDVDDRRKKIKIRSSRSSTLTAPTVTKKSFVNPKKRLIQQKSTRAVGKSIVPSVNTAVAATKKKIRIIRKRPTSSRGPCERKVAAWVKKYNIEDCCVRLDLYNPARDAERI